MNSSQENYLWDPHVQPDAEIAEIEQLLKPLGSSALDLGSLRLPLSRAAKPHVRWHRWLPVAAAAMFAGIYFAHIYRLSWVDGSPWPLVVASDGINQSSLLRVGEEFTTMPGQTATLSAARIGTVVVAQNSSVRLVQTQKGRHRIELERGQLHAKIWAPPAYFGVATRDAMILDIGCEFDLLVDGSGRGTISVASGWINYRHHGTGLGIPEGYAATFDDDGANTPVRVDALDGFRELVAALDSQLRSNPSDEQRIDELTTRIASSARDSDYFTLLSLLNRHQQWAQGPLYPRLAIALGTSSDDAHRMRWAQGDVDAINQWWKLLPTQPKSWWVHWQDAF